MLLPQLESDPESVKRLRREAVAGAAGFSLATQVSPFAVSPVLHSRGQTRAVCLLRSATRASVTSWPPDDLPWIDM